MNQPRCYSTLTVMGLSTNNRKERNWVHMRFGERRWLSGPCFTQWNSQLFTSVPSERHTGGDIIGGEIQLAFWLGGREISISSKSYVFNQWNHSKYILRLKHVFSLITVYFVGIPNPKPYFGNFPHKITY